MANPPSRTLSFQALVIESDPDWARKYQRPVVYKFSNGRTFEFRPDVYTTPGP